MSSVRIDRWLCAARIYKSRTLAHKACDVGEVKINGAKVRASHVLRVGDEVRAEAPRGTVILRVLALAERRQSPPQAKELYEDHSPPPPPRDERFGERAIGSGRPTKLERRAFERMRGGF
jgi:ribosome-associated heat shock protein Hsp15